MNLNDKIRKCVIFLGIRPNGRFLPRATAFLVSHFEDQHRFDHLVTAEHVVAGLLSKGHKIWARYNLTNGKSTEIQLNAEEFFYHPTNDLEPADVAVMPIMPRQLDEGEAGAELSSLTLYGGTEAGFLPTEAYLADSAGLGSEIAIVGLFRSHYGSNRNIPIVRVGSISAMPEEPVRTKYCGYITAYLVEARSISGLSGSPVFSVPAPATLLARGLQSGGQDFGQAMALLGLMHGHFDVPNLNEDVVIDEEEPKRGVHTGIGVVVPFKKIMETINQPKLLDMRKKNYQGES